MAIRPGKLRSRAWMKRPFLLRAALFLFLFGMVALLPAFTLAPETSDWAPKPLRLWAYDTRLLIGRSITAAVTVKDALYGNTAVAIPPTGEDVAIKNGDITLAGTLYNPATAVAGGNPAILLLHGSTPEGRKLGMYRLLGQALSTEGYVVLAIDQRGYGQSSNPPDLTDPASFAYVDDVAVALDYLAALPRVNPDQITLIGHSFGGDVALTAVADSATTAAMLNKLILIGPGRGFMARGGTPDAPEFEYFLRREMRYMYLWRAIPADTFLSYRATLPLENHRDYLAQPDHLPILLVDGALESDKDRAFLADVFAAMGGEKAYVTLPAADHYANVANFGPVIIYDEDALAALVTAVTTFLQPEK